MSTTIHVKDGQTFSNETNFSPKSTKVGADTEVILQSAGKNAGDISVYTYNEAGVSISAFTTGEPPYTATADGAGFTLAVTGKVVLSLSSTLVLSGEPDTGSNGTINVGGGETDAPA